MFQDQKLSSLAGQRKIKTIIAIEDDEAISEVLQYALMDVPSYYILLVPNPCEAKRVFRSNRKNKRIRPHGNRLEED